MSNKKNILELLKLLSTCTSEGLSKEEIARLLNLSEDDVRSSISISRGQDQEIGLIDTIFKNPSTGQNKKRYRWTDNYTQIQKWRKLNMPRTNGVKLGKPSY